MRRGTLRLLDVIMLGAALSIALWLWLPTYGAQPPGMVRWQHLPWWWIGLGIVGLLLLRGALLEHTRPWRMMLFGGAALLLFSVGWDWQQLRERPQHTFVVPNCIESHTSAPTPNATKTHLGGAMECFVEDLSLSSDGMVAGVAVKAGALQLWDTDTKMLLCNVATPGPTTAVTFTPDSQQVVITGVAATHPSAPNILMGYLWAFDSSDCRATARLSLPHSDITALTFSQHAQEPLLALGLANGRIDIRRWPTLEPLHALLAHERHVSDVVFVPRLGVMISAGLDGRLHMWDSSTWQRTQSLSYSTEAAITSVALYDTDDTTLAPPTAETASAQQTTTSLLLALGTSNGQVHLWDLSQGKRLRSFGAHQGLVTHLTFLTKSQGIPLGMTAEGFALASSSPTEGVRMWDSRGKLLQLWSSGGKAFAVQQRAEQQDTLILTEQVRLIHIWHIPHQIAAAPPPYLPASQASSTHATTPSLAKSAPITTPITTPAAPPTWQPREGKPR